MPTLTRHDVELIHQHSLGLLERVGIGGQDDAGLAHAEALDILHNHRPPPLSAGAEEKIEAIVAEADSALA